MKILNILSQSISSHSGELLSELGEVDSLSLSRSELMAKASEYDVFMIGLGLHIDREILDQATNLRVICTATTGLDHIDLDYAKQKGIEVLSLKGEETFLNSITGTAELAFGLLLDISRNISHSMQSVLLHQWNREEFCGHSLQGKTLGIVGFGRLGRMMAQYGKAFGMSVLVYDPYKNESECDLVGVKKVDFETLLEKCDAVSIHVHLNEETQNMFHFEVLKKMKPNAYIINTSRGKIVNEKDVIEALKQKIIAGYATDVLSDEVTFQNVFESNDLVNFAKENRNVLITPHIGGMTYESREATDIFMVKKLKKYLQDN